MKILENVKLIFNQYNFVLTEFVFIFIYKEYISQQYALYVYMLIKRRRWKCETWKMAFSTLQFGAVFSCLAFSQLAFSMVPHFHVSHSVAQLSHGKNCGKSTKGSAVRPEGPKSEATERPTELVGFGERQLALSPPARGCREHCNLPVSRCNLPGVSEGGAPVLKGFLAFYRSARWPL